MLESVGVICVTCRWCAEETKHVCKHCCVCMSDCCLTAIPSSSVHWGAQIRSHQKTETGLSGKKINALKCP